MEDLVSKFINEFFPPSRTTNLRNEISNFQQRFDESFHEAWDGYKDLLRACPHHGCTELHQLDTFYNALNPTDQNSLNSAAGGNMLERRTQDVLTIIENKSKIGKLTHAVNQPTSAVTTAMTTILEQFQATPPPASVKAIEEICVTCGGAHPYYQCLAAGGNTFSELQDNIQGYVAAAAFNYKQGNSSYCPPAITTRSGIVLDGPSVPVPSPFINPKEDEHVEETLTDQDLAEYTIKLKLQEMSSFRLASSQSQLSIVDYESDPRFPLIVGRPFLRTARALIDVHREEMILQGGNVLIEKFLDLDSTKDLHPPHNVNPLSGSTTSSSSPNHLLEEFADELALITFPLGNDDLPFDIKTDLKEIEYLLNNDPIKEMDSILEDSVDEIESDTEYVYDDPFDSKGEKIKESKLLIDELNLPSDFLPSFEYDSFISEDFFDVDALPSTNNEDKPAISHASLILEDFDPPLYELPFFKEVPGAETLPSFSSKNKEKVFKPGILTNNEDKVFNPRNLRVFKTEGPCVSILVSVGCQKPGHLAARLGCAETKVVTWDDLAFKLINLGWNVLMVQDDGLVLFKCSTWTRWPYFDDKVFILVVQVSPLVFPEFLLVVMLIFLLVDHFLLVKFIFLLEEDIPVKARTFKQMQDDILGEQVAKRLHDEEQAQLDRQRAELQRHRQQEVLDSAMYYTEEDWIHIRAQSMARVKSFTNDQLKEEFKKIQKAISNIQIQDFSQTLKRTGPVLEEPSSKRQKSTEAHILTVPDDSDDEAPPVWSALVGWEVIPTPLGDINALYRMDRSTSYFTTLREILHMVDRQDLLKLCCLILMKEVRGLVFGNINICGRLLYTLSNVHILETVSGEVLYLIADVSYPLSVKLMERMLTHKLEIDTDVVGNDMTTAEQLIQFIKNQLPAAQVSFV
nr:reverse transcriptase domain-containing protein [Tanacetum cinerariifolium]